MSKNTLNDLKTKFGQTTFKKKFSNIITVTASKMDLDRKRVKLLMVILIAMFICFLDIVWLVVPYQTKPEGYQPPPYKIEEVPALVNKYQKVLAEKPGDFKAHYELGRIYVFIKEPERAKIEFFQAIESSPPGNLNASFSLIDLYVKEKKPGMAEEMIAGIDEKSLSREQLLTKADFLLAISKLYFGLNDFDGSYRNLKEATNYYAKLDNKEKLDASKKELAYLLVDMADNAYFNQNNPTKATIYLDESQKLEENAWAYAKLGYLFFENPKLSAEYFEKAYSFEPTSVNNDVFIQILSDAIQLSKNEGREGDRAYYKGVFDRVREENLRGIFYTKIALSNVEGFYEKQENQEFYLPVVYIDIHNTSDKNPLTYLKVRAVFIDNNNKIVGHHDVIAINSSEPLPPDKYKNTIRIESNRLLKATDKENTAYKVLLYISKKRPDEWAYSTSKILRY